MYEIVAATPKDIVIIYIAFLGACFVTYPIIRLIVKTIDRGANKWK